MGRGARCRGTDGPWSWAVRPEGSAAPALRAIGCDESILGCGAANPRVAFPGHGLEQMAVKAVSRHCEAADRARDPSVLHLSKLVLALDPTDASQES